MFNKFKNFIKLTNKKRLVVLISTIIATIFAMVFSVFKYVAPQSKLGIEYAGGYEYLIEISTGASGDNASAEDVEESNRIANDVAQEIYERIDDVGSAGVVVEAETRVGQNAAVRIQIPDIHTNDEQELYEKFITEKPNLTLTDIYANPLFTQNGKFDSVNLTSGSDPGRFVHGDIEQYNFRSSWTPIQSGGASARVNQQGTHEVIVQLEDANAAAQWFEVTNHISNTTNTTIAMWLDLNALVDFAKEGDWVNEWNASGKNPFNFVHVEETPGNSLKEYQFNAKQYLISAANVDSPLGDIQFVISGNFSGEEARKLARSINYGVSSYTLDILSSNYVSASYGDSAFQRTIVAGAIVFVLIALFLIWNYGLLGLISSISIGLFITLTLVSFTFMAGVYTPEAIAALIIGIGMSVDANIITFERLKNEYYAGSNLKKSSKKANNKSVITILDSNITTGIVAFVLFYFGTRSIIGLSVTLILSIFFTLVIMLGLTRIMTALLINSEYFNKYPSLFGMRKNKGLKIQESIDRIDYVKSSNKLMMSSFGLISIGVVVMTILSLISMSFGATFNLSQDFKGGTVIDVAHRRQDINLDNEQYENIKQVLINNGVSTSEIQTIYDGTNIKSVKVNVDRDLNITTIRNLIDAMSNTSIYISNTTTAVAQKLVKDAMIAIAIAFAVIVLYTLIRFRWTFSLSAIIALVHDGLIVTAIFIFTRVEVSPVFIAGLLSVIGYSINDTIVTFDRIREKLDESSGELNENKVKDIANSAIRDTFKRSIMTSLTTISAIIVLMSFGNATRFTFNFAMLIGLLSGTYSSIFIASGIWVKLEIWRLRKQKKREQLGYWNIHEVEEQTFVGINDFKI